MYTDKFGTFPECFPFWQIWWGIQRRSSSMERLTNHFVFTKHWHENEAPTSLKTGDCMGPEKQCLRRQVLPMRTPHCCAQRITGFMNNIMWASHTPWPTREFYLFNRYKLQVYTSPHTNQKHINHLSNESTGAAIAIIGGQEVWESCCQPKKRFPTLFLAVSSQPLFPQVQSWRDLMKNAVNKLHLPLSISNDQNVSWFLLSQVMGILHKM